MILLSALLALAAAILLLPAVADLLALHRRWRGRTRPAPSAAGPLPHLLFLVPAHDEELLIAGCVTSLRALDHPEGTATVVVVADNCHDRTAALARAAGATCLERRDPDRPGKPHAINWALGRIPWEEHDAVVIVDADSEVEPGFVAALARCAPLRSKAVQGDHRVLNPGDSALTRLGALLGAANHRFAYPVKQRGDLNTPLLGNGMAIGADLLARYGWPAYTICEDWEMYAFLTAAGERIDGCPDARVASQEAHTLAQSGSQRRRWTAGKVTVLFRFLRPLLASRRIAPAQKLDAIAELSAPGPAVHLAIVAAGVLLLTVTRAPHWGTVAALLLASLLRNGVYALAALRELADPWPTLRAFAVLPWYTLWRAGVALGSLAMLGDRPWVRTARHASPGPSKG